MPSDFQRNYSDLGDILDLEALNLAAHILGHSLATKLPKIPEIARLVT